MIQITEVALAFFSLSITLALFKGCEGRILGNGITAVIHETYPHSSMNVPSLAFGFRTETHGGGD